jgi:hypothetical protein
LPAGAAQFGVFSDVRNEPDQQLNRSSLRAYNKMNFRVACQHAEHKIVPEEQLRIARRFNAGISRHRPLSPEGTAEYSTVPTGLENVASYPGVKTPGYCQTSVRGGAQRHCHFDTGS